MKPRNLGFEKGQGLVMRVHLVSEHELMRRALRSVLKKLGKGVTVTECEKIEDASEYHEPFDLIILDFGISMSSVSTIEDIRSQFPSTPVVVLVEDCVRQDVVDAFAAGVSGFMSRSMRAMSLLHALQLVLSGELYGPVLFDDDQRAGIIEHNSRRTAQSNPLEILTPREQDVLGHLLQGLSNKGIAKRLNIEETTVKLHMKGIFRKFGATNRTEAVRIAEKYGANHGIPGQ